MRFNVRLSLEVALVLCFTCALFAQDPPNPLIPDDPKTPTPILPLDPSRPIPQSQPFAIEAEEPLEIGSLLTVPRNAVVTLVYSGGYKVTGKALLIKSDKDVIVLQLTSNGQMGNYYMGALIGVEYAR